MKDFFYGGVWNTIVLVILGILAVITGEIVTFAMLGMIMIMLSNIYDKLDEISKKMNNK